LFVLLPALAADWSTLKSSGDRHYTAGEYDAAFADYSQALTMVAADSTDNAALSLDLGKVYWMRGDYQHAQSLAEHALEIYQKAYGPDHPSDARALSDIGFALHGAGDYTGAEPYLERALEIDRKALGPEHLETVTVLERVAFNLQRAGDYARAKVLEEEALAIAERTLGPDHPLTGQALRVLGQVLVELGDYPGAMAYQQRALAILEARVGKDAVEVGDTLVTMGNGAKDSGFYTQAQQYYERAAAVYEKKLGQNTKVGGALDDLGQDFVLMGRYEDARRTFERALAIQTKELGPRHPWTGNLIQGLAKVEAGEGHYDKARELYLQNLDIWRERLGPAHPFTVVSMTLLADVLRNMGRYDEALDMALQAASIRRDNIALTVRSVDERQALRYADLHTASLDTALAIAAMPATSAAARAKSWDALIRSRALVLDEMGARHRSIVLSEDAEVRKLAQRTAMLRSEAAKLVLQGSGKLSPAEYGRKVDQSRAELAHAEEALALKSVEFRHELGQRRAGLEEVRAALPASSALVAFRRYRGAADSYLAFVLPAPGREVVAVPLGAAPHIDGLVSKWRDEIARERDSFGRNAKANEASYRAAATALRAAVWDPVAKRIAAASRVFIVPDGALQLVNFAALPAGGSQYLAEAGPLLHVLSTERDLTAPAPKPAGAQLLAVADPQFDGAPGTPLNTRVYRGTHSTCGDFGSMKFSALPGSLDEVRAIREIWKARGWRSQVLSGTSATEAAVKTQAAGKRVLHLATHGFFLDAACPQAAGAARENPLLRAGLALSGANLHRAARKDDEDGVLTAEEVASLNLEDTEWVVLSGCETAVGDVRAGEGVLGLRRAFQEAGARTLIASLWPVDDQDTREWMTSLYRARFVERKNTAEALRSADRARIASRRSAEKSTHPFYWAGFVAVGDWR
jgi:CHAT domain-containing protein/Tfp pilus assembly protein PilF